MRTQHYAAFEQAVKVAVPALSALVFDADVPVNPDGTVRRSTYLVLHDMGFDRQDDERLTVTAQDAAEGRYRVVVRVVATTRSAARSTVDAVRSLIGVRPTVAGRFCQPIAIDPGPYPIERDDDVKPPIFYTDLDFTFRSQRA
ncbi:hypothetical protein ACSBPH_01580 [Microbacterium sp. F51-2R]|uniref:hypothetical protein n=1 Tax=Microbacterium sp. F51-2R TaxID=3445777 RepID=UPI003F9F4C94